MLPSRRCPARGRPVFVMVPYYRIFVKKERPQSCLRPFLCEIFPVRRVCYAFTPVLGLALPVEGAAGVVGACACFSIVTEPVASPSI